MEQSRRTARISPAWAASDVGCFSAASPEEVSSTEEAEDDSLAERLLPGLLDVFEDDENDEGMHRTDTVDIDIVLSGEIDLVLDSGDRVTLRACDIVVQNGTRHAWQRRGEEKAVLAAWITGADRMPG
jgi:hypothetical protein